MQINRGTVEDAYKELISSGYTDNDITTRMIRSVVGRGSLSTISKYVKQIRCNNVVSIEDIIKENNRKESDSDFCTEVVLNDCTEEDNVQNTGECEGQLKHVQRTESSRYICTDDNAVQHREGCTSHVHVGVQHKEMPNNRLYALISFAMYAMAVYLSGCTNIEYFKLIGIDSPVLYTIFIEACLVFLMISLHRRIFNRKILVGLIVLTSLYLLVNQSVASYRHTITHITDVLPADNSVQIERYNKELSDIEASIKNIEKLKWPTEDDRKTKNQLIADRRVLNQKINSIEATPKLSIDSSEGTSFLGLLMDMSFLNSIFIKIFINIMCVVSLHFMFISCEKGREDSTYSSNI